MTCPDISNVDLVLQGARQPVARFESRAAVDIYFRKRPGMDVGGNVYVYAVMGAMRILLGQHALPVGNAYPSGELVLSIRNIMAEAVEVDTDGTTYAIAGPGAPLDPYGSFSVVAWGDQPVEPAPTIPAFPSVIATVSVGQQLAYYSPTWGINGATPLVAGSDLYQVIVTSKSASNAWLLVYDRATPPTDGAQAIASTLIVAIPVPAASLAAVDFTPQGLTVVNGVSWVLSSSPNVQTSLVATDWKTLWQYRHN
jgi:hypothetical protein